MNNMRYFLNKAISEVIGTFAIVFFGCGAITLSSQLSLKDEVLFIPLIFGAVVSVMIYALGHISGAHFNPAVTIAFAAVKRFPKSEVILYIVSQVLGAILGSLAINFIFSDPSTLGATIPSIATSKAFFVEALLTFFLMLVIMSVATDSRAVGMLAGIAIGFTVFIDAAVGGYFTGASMNPARSIGPALVEGNLTSLWLYIVAPSVGAVLAALTYEFIRCETKEVSKEPVKGCC